MVNSASPPIPSRSKGGPVDALRTLIRRVEAVYFAVCNTAIRSSLSACGSAAAHRSSRTPFSAPALTSPCGRGPLRRADTPVCAPPVTGPIRIAVV